MKHWVKATALLGALAMLTAMGGCNLVKVDPEMDQGQVVAVVNGLEITKDRYQTSYENYEYQMQQYGSTAEGMEEYVLDSVIEYELLKQEAEKQGYYDLSGEREEEFNTEYENYVSQIEEAYFRQTAETELGEGASEEDIAAKMAQLFDEDLAAQGYTRDELRQDLLDSAAITWMQEDFMETISVTDDEIQAWYDKALEEQTAAIVEDPSVYEQYMMYSPPALYVPEGYRDVKHILIAFDEDTNAQLTELVAQQDEIASQMGELMRDEQNNAVQIDELRQQNKDLAAQMETLKADTKVKAEEILAKVDAGEDFDMLMLEYSDDTGSNSDEGYLENGMRIGPETTAYVEEFTNGALELDLNEVSGLVETTYGYHIIKNINNVAKGAVSLEDVKEEAETNALSSKQGEEWSKLLEQWKEEGDIEKYLDLLTDNSENYAEEDAG